MHMWLTDGIVAKNWALIQELLELLHLCPVKIERLKSNNCPKLIKGLSKEVSHQGVRLLASRLVEQWLKIVKGEAAPNSVPAQIIGGTNSHGGNSRMHGAEHYAIADGSSGMGEEGNEPTTVKVQDLEPTTSNYTIETNSPPSQPMQLHILNPSAVPTAQAQQQQQQQQQVQHITKQSYVVVGNGTSVMPTGPVCKITIRDGNHVLVKVETDAANINNAMNSCREMNGEAESDAAMEQQNDGEDEEMAVERLDDENFEQMPEETCDDTKISKNSESTGTKNKESKENSSSTDSNKSSDKENRDSHKTDDKKSTISSSSDKKSSSSSSKSSSSKHSSSSHRSSSSHHRSSHRSSSSSSSSTTRGSSSKSSKDKDRHHHSSSSSRHSSSSSSKNKSDRDKEREKEKLKKDQADKDKATLEKVQAQALSSKLGKIPKKKADEEKPSSTGDSGVRKSSTDSKDSSKENKDKTEAKKNVVIANSTILEKKNISISIENRKNSLDPARPKTVKTFNSKFRSTGLEEEVKPPPPRSAAKKPPGNVIEKKIIPPKPLTSLKRPSPLRETSTPADKRAKLSLDPPSEPVEEKKGAIKLISPKPKRKYALSIATTSFDNVTNFFSHLSNPPTRFIPQILQFSIFSRFFFFVMTPFRNFQKYFCSQFPTWRIDF